MFLRYLYTISKLCASILNFVFFDIGVSLLDPAWATVAPTRYWTQIAVCTLQCESIIARGSYAARAALSCRSGGCTRRRCRTGRTGRSTGRSRRSALGPAEGARLLVEYVKLNLVPESQWPSRRSARFPLRRIVNHNHGLNNGISQSLHGGGVLVLPDSRNHQRNAGVCDSAPRLE